MVSFFMACLLSSYKSFISGAIGLMNSASTFDSNEMAEDLWGREGNRDDEEPTGWGGVVESWVWLLGGF